MSRSRFWYASDPKSEENQVAIREYHGHADLGEDDYHEWIMPESSNPIAADSTGRANPRINSKNWVWLLCNNSNCNAQAMIHPARVLDVYASSHIDGHTL